MKSRKSAKATLKKDSDRFPIVAIGASAGGIDALIEILKDLPTDTGMAFVFVQHQSIHNESLLLAILSRMTEMDVVVCANGLRLRPNKIFVVPPNAEIKVSGGQFWHFTRSVTSHRHMPVDILFGSLAEDQGGFAVGVLLSEGEGDGVEGLKRIQEAGGTTIVRDPLRAKTAEGLYGAITSGVSDLRLGLKDIAKELVTISKHPSTYFSETHSLELLKSKVLELQAVNKELLIMNEELTSRNRSLSRTNEDLNKLIGRLSSRPLSPVSQAAELLDDTISQSVVFLDARMCVKRVNQGFSQAFGLKEDDINEKSFFEISDGAWNLPMLKALLDEVITKNAYVVDFQISQEFPFIGTRNLVINARRIDRDREANILVIIDDTSSSLETAQTL